MPNEEDPAPRGRIRTREPPHARQRLNPEDAAPAPALNGIVTMCIYFSLFFPFFP